jgi:hydrogenase 3 maturation protease
LGDDGAGVEIVRQLAGQLPSDEHLLLIEAGAAPENCTGRLRAFAPDHILLVDCADIGLDPGESRWLDLDTVCDVGGMTHSPSLALLADYLTSELACSVWLFGIQPGAIGLDRGLSPSLQTGIIASVDRLRTRLADRQPPGVARPGDPDRAEPDST